MRISTAPTPFDAVPKEDREAWLQMRPTIALLDAVDQRIAELRAAICGGIDMNATEADLGLTYRAVRLNLDAYEQVRSWLKSAEVPRAA